MQRFEAESSSQRCHTDRTCAGPLQHSDESWVSPAVKRKDVYEIAAVRLREFSDKCGKDTILYSSVQPRLSSQTIENSKRLSNLGDFGDDLCLLKSEVV